MAHTGKAFVNWKAKERKLEDEKEVRIQGALQELMARKPKVTSVAAVACHYNVPYDALYSWHKYKHKSHSKAQVDQQLLIKAQEETLSMWIKYMGMRGQPISKQSLHVKVSEISRVLQEKERKTGKQQLPGKNWVYVLLDHYPGLSLKWLTGLDPLHAQNFNPTVVSQHFKLLGDFLRTYDIPWDNIYNMDKKGIQLGGGRRLDSTKYLYSQNQTTWVKIQSANLELIMIIECVSADGAILKPGFVFSRKHVLHNGYIEEEGVLWVTSTTLNQRNMLTMLAVSHCPTRVGWVITLLSSGFWSALSIRQRLET